MQLLYTCAAARLTVRSDAQRARLHMVFQSRRNGDIGQGSGSRPAFFTKASFENHKYIRHHAHKLTDSVPRGTARKCLLRNRTKTSLLRVRLSEVDYAYLTSVLQPSQLGL
jgi:hypothetical protein